MEESEALFGGIYGEEWLWLQQKSGP